MQPGPCSKITCTYRHVFQQNLRNVHSHTCKFQTLELTLVNLTNSVIAGDMVFIIKRSIYLSHSVKRKWQAFIFLIHSNVLRIS